MQQAKFTTRYSPRWRQMTTKRWEERRKEKRREEKRREREEKRRRERRGEERRGEERRGEERRGEERGGEGRGGEGRGGEGRGGEGRGREGRGGEGRELPTKHQNKTGQYKNHERRRGTEQSPWQRAHANEAHLRLSPCPTGQIWGPAPCQTSWARLLGYRIYWGRRKSFAHETRGGLESQSKCVLKSPDDLSRDIIMFYEIHLCKWTNSWIPRKWTHTEQ